jgi:hypothetical protein
MEVTMPWFLDGNAGTLANNFFLGTLDNAPLVIKTNVPLSTTPSYTPPAAPLQGEVMRVTPSSTTARGRVGIGTSQPEAPLHVAVDGISIQQSSQLDVAVKGGSGDNGDGGSAGVFGFASGPNSNGVVGEANNGQNAYGVWGMSASGFAGNFDGRVRVLGDLTVLNGNVGIETTTNPTQKLQLDSGNVLLPNANLGIDGNLYFGGTTDTGQFGMRLFGGRVNPGPNEIHAGFIDVKTDVNSDGLRIRVDTNNGGTERMRITAQGRVGIGVAAPGFPLDVAGQAHATSFPTSSDVKLKTNVKQLSNVLEKVDKIRAVSFEWNKEYESLGRSTGRTEIGVIGQEVEAVFPELVTEWGDEKYKAVDYGRLAGVLIEAVKELKAQVKEMKAQNEALQSRFEALERA